MQLAEHFEGKLGKKMGGFGIVYGLPYRRRENIFVLLFEVGFR